MRDLAKEEDRIGQAQSALSFLQSITGIKENTSMRELASANFANKLEQWVMNNGADNLPDGLKKYLKEDGKIDKDKITKDYEEQYNRALELQSMKRKAQQDIQRDRYNYQMAQDRARFDMSRTQYGPTIIGRSFQYDDQQLLHWQTKYDTAQLQIKQDEANIKMLEAQRDKIDEKDVKEREAVNEQINAANHLLEQHKGAADEAKAGIDEFSGTMGHLRTVLMNTGNALESLIMRLGRRALLRAFREATTFVKQFNADMISIQQISGKSDDEMKAIRESSLKQARELKTSVANVTSTRVMLYRQGLSDDEVNERTESIIKFSTVTGAKITTATKNLTAAIQTGLVSSVEEAMDVLVALGDSAATSAEEISKGMQKAAASAKVAGVSYEELTSMLTIATSKTQLSGTQAGTFFQTLFSRMNRVTKEGYYNDESGETTSINDVEAALKNVGISLRDSKTTFRSSFDVLRDVAKIWEGLNDLQKNNITYAMVGNRNANMFNALMDGMGEDGGALLDEYLGLASNAEGATQSKYEIAIQGIQAALNNLKTSYDEFIASLGSSNIITTVLDGISSVAQGITTLNDQTTGLFGTFTTLGSIVAALTVKFAMLALVKDTALKGIAGFASTLAAFGVGAAALGLGGMLGNVFNTPEKESESDKQKEKSINTSEKIKQEQDLANNNIETIKSVTSAYSSMNQVMTEAPEKSEALRIAVTNLQAVFPELRGKIDETNDSLDQYVTFIKEAEEASKKLTKNQIDVAIGNSRELIDTSIETALENINSNANTTPTSEEAKSILDYEIGNTYNLMEKYTVGSLLGMQRALASMTTNGSERYGIIGTSNNDWGTKEQTLLRSTLDTYLKNDVYANKGVWEGINSADELLNSDINIVQNEEAVDLFIKAIMGEQKTKLLGALLDNNDAVKKEFARSQLNKLFKTDLIGLTSPISQYDNNLLSAMIDLYASRYNLTEWFNSDNVIDFLAEMNDP